MRALLDPRTMNIDKPRLRNALKKLRQVPLDHTNPANVAMAPQEMLDYLAMLAGLKPVCLVGRGFDDSDWVAGVERLAREMRLQVVNGAKWHAESEHAGLPDWYSDVAPTGPDPIRTSKVSTAFDGSAVYWIFQAPKQPSKLNASPAAVNATG